MSPNEPTSRLVKAGWGAALIALCLWTVWRIGGFDLTATLSDGTVVPNTYGTVDHPFHASRAAVVLDALRNGEIVRWMASHQGGYPVEFYPLGVAWIDVLLWAITFGTVSILAIHKLAVALVFVLPALAFWLLARADRIHPAAAFVAMAIHVAVPGHWLNGGYEELVGWGLVTNVTGSTFALISAVLLARYVLYCEHWAGVAAILAISAGAVSNPRSLFAVAIAALAIGTTHILRSSNVRFRDRVQDTVVSIGLVGALSFMIAAPVVLALLRFSDQYFFLHYQFYKPLRMYWDALVTALSIPVLLVAIVAVVTLLTVLRRARTSAALATAVAFYSVFTILVARSENSPPLVEQLEAPRLMPFQRMAMIAQAAILLVTVMQWTLTRWSGRWRETVIAVIVVVGSIVGISYMSDESRGGAINEHALYPVSTVGTQRFADFEAATRLANQVRPDGTAVFVIGNAHEWWHEQLWAPGIANGTYYYDDWLWYWHVDQPGPYHPDRGYWMPNPTNALTMEYFWQHGIGVVMVSDMPVADGIPPRQAAANTSSLDLVESFGSWDVYRVLPQTSIATRSDALPESVRVQNGRITASFSEGSGDILVRQNWFPRWNAIVNGNPAPVTRSPEGYMLIRAQDGAIELVLEYGVTTSDWIARAASVTGLIGTALFAWRGSRLRTGEINPNEG